MAGKILAMKYDINSDIKEATYPEKQVQTNRSGYFVFKIGVSFEAIQSLLDRVNDAQERFRNVPVLPDIATLLEKEVIVSSIFGTNTIEGGTLSQEETAALLDLEENTEAKEEKERRVTNIRAAYGTAEKFAKTVVAAKAGAIHLQEVMITDLHATITDGLIHPRNVPGQYRDNEKGDLTRVGDEEHGGVYVAPKCLDDIQLLVKEFLAWINSDEIRTLSPLIRAPLVHYYFERIHPFGDGNGRVGRVLEALVLKCSGFKYAPFAMSRYYLEHIDEYFTLFNVVRKAAEKHETYPNTAFVEFFLGGMREVINKLHNRVNVMVSGLLFQVQVNNMLQSKTINMRQFTILNNLMAADDYDLNRLQSQPWYKGLYSKLKTRTQYRDLKQMVALDLIQFAKGKRIKLPLPGL